MSAFICLPDHIGLLAAHSYSGYDDRRDEVIQKIKSNAILLAKLNWKSVRCRYGAEGVRNTAGCTLTSYLHQCEIWAERMYKDERAQKVPPVWILKLVDCYKYQSCECDRYQHEEAWKLASLISEKAWTRLPGYDQAPWSFDVDFLANVPNGK